MKRLLPAAYLLSVYAWMPVVNWFNSLEGEKSAILRLLYAVVFLLPVITGVCNCIYAGKLRKAGNGKDLLTNAVIIKYGMIPFFIYGAGLVLGVLVASIAPIMWIFGVPLLIPLFLTVGYLLMVLGSGYTIAYARRRIQENPVARIGYVLGIVGSFFFVFDVIAVMVMSWKEKRFRPLTVMIIVVFALEFLAVIGLIVYVIVSAASGA